MDGLELFQATVKSASKGESLTGQPKFDKASVHGKNLSQPPLQEKIHSYL